MRLFVAIELADRVRSALAEVQTRLNNQCRGVRWVPAAQLHLTVRFLGEVPHGRVAGVAQAVACGASKAAPFTMEIAGCGCFPPRGPVRIIWAGAREESGALVQCVEAVAGQLDRIGFARERRPWSAHITIGRVREDRSQSEMRSAVEALRFGSMVQPVETVQLMSSVLSPKGPRYSVVSTAPLGQTEDRRQAKC